MGPGDGAFRARGGQCGAPSDRAGGPEGENRIVRVLFITGEFPPQQGGVGDCTNEIAQALAKHGAEVSVLTTDGGSRTGDGSDEVVQVFRNMPRWGWGQLSLLRHALAVTRADILHVQYQTGAFGMHPMINFAPHLLRLFRPSPSGRGGWGARMAVTFHDLRNPYLFPKAGRVRDWVTFELARGSDAVIATNRADYDRLRIKSAGGHRWLTLIPIGSNIPPTSLPPDFNRVRVRDRLGVREDESLLVYFGFLNESKGAETLIRALYDLPKTRLLMLGGQTGTSDPTNVAYRGHIKQEIERYNLNSRVIWTDFLPATEVSAHFRAADICVLPYRDGASFRRGSFMAALAHGMPIVTTRAAEAQDEGTVRAAGRESKDEGSGAGMLEGLPVLNPYELPALRDGENVLLVSPDDPTALAVAVQRLQTSQGLAARLSANALAAARAFSWDKIADAHLELYERLLDD